MISGTKHALGLDFGTESVRALLVDLDGNEVGSAVSRYAHGQIEGALPSGESLPERFALQDPSDWLSGAEEVVRSALEKARLNAADVIGIGVDFTSCTMLPTLGDGTPLCQLDQFRRNPHGWPKLWKHHGAQQQADRITFVARERQEPFLDRYGSTIGLEWFFPKILEVVENAPDVNDAAEVWLEAGDWFVWQLVGGSAEDLPRSTCQAGYKAMWSDEEGYPTEQFLAAVHPGLPEIVRNKLPGRLVAPGTSVGGLCDEMADRFGLRSGTPVSAAIIDAHAAVPGVGAGAPGTLVMVMGTSSCYMLNASESKPVTGVAGIVKDGILPGYYGYETGQAAVGDAFDWVRTLCGQVEHETLATEAATLPPGADGVVAVDWINGCRTPLMDGHLAGAFVGLRRHHRPVHLYRAMLEASAFGLRWILETLESGGVKVNELIATGGLPHHNPTLVQVYADVLGRAVTIHPSKQGPALGAAVLGTLAAGSERSGFSNAMQAVEVMAAPRQDDPNRRSTVVHPVAENAKPYDSAYAAYRRLTQFLQSMESE